MKPLITVEGVSASYDGKKVLDNISLTIYDDDYLGIIGPNGGPTVATYPSTAMARKWKR